MVHVNPHYNSEWETIHDRHAVERARLEKERDHLAKAGAMTSDAYRQVLADFDRHHEACLACFKMQHATVQGYAEWLFRGYDVSMGDYTGGIPVPLVDFIQLRTVEEADAEWSRVYNAVKDSASEKLNSLPTGQPEGLAAFADLASRGLVRYWRTFSPRELFPVGCTGGLGTRTLVTVDERADGLHVCFMQDWNTVGVSVTNAIQQLATAVYREACALAEQQRPQASGIRAWLARRPATRGAGLDPGMFRFYQHIPPRGLFMREQFDRIELDFREGKYRDPNWVAYGVVPAVIQSAQFDCALDASLQGAQRRLALQDSVSLEAS